MNSHRIILEMQLVTKFKASDWEYILWSANCYVWDGLELQARCHYSRLVGTCFSHLMKPA